MYTDYKIVEEKMEAGVVFYHRVRYYLGDNVNVQKKDILDDTTLVQVTVYSRNDMYEEVEYVYG
jgi:hypothetical protein